MQHAVLGFGSSMYDTFMNCPRLCDKYLGDCGSRRMVQRAELDEVDEAGGAGDECDQIDLPEYKRWSSDMLKVLIKLPAATKPKNLSRSRCICSTTLGRSTFGMPLTPAVSTGQSSSAGFVCSFLAISPASRFSSSCCGN